MLTKENAVKMAVPPDFRERYVVRCLKHTFAPSRAGNPMVTLEFEVVGKPNEDSSKVSPTVEKGGVTYQIAGLRVNRVYFTLLDGPALQRWIEFYEAATGQPFDGVDETNPDLTFCDGLLMEAILSVETQIERKALSPDDRAAGKQQGDPILDSKGQEIKRDQVVLASFVSKFEGNLNNPY